MSNNRKSPKRHMSKKTKTSITVALFILAILVVILCIMSGALHFEPGVVNKTEPTPTPVVTAPEVSPSETPEPEESKKPDKPVTYTVTVFAGHGGSATPSGTTTVEEGQSVTIVFTPDAGYHVSTLTINGELVDPVNDYTFHNISDNMTVDVSFDTVTVDDESSIPVIEGQTTFQWPY